VSAGNPYRASRIEDYVASLGLDAYVVGGAVRDELLGHEAKDADFLVPGVEEALRVNGTARLSRTQPLLDIMAVDGKVPKLAIVVTVTEAFLHCAKALKRARLWADDYRIDRKQLPTLGRMIVEQARPVGLTAEEADARIEADYRTNLY